MKKFLAELEKDLDEALDRLNAARREITGGVVEDSARRAGEWTADRVEKAFDEMDIALAKAALAAKEYTARASEKGDEYVKGIGRELKELREDIRALRQELNRDVGRKAAVKVIDAFHARIDGMVQQCRDERREW